MCWHELQVVTGSQQETWTLLISQWKYKTNDKQ